ncbi:MAG: HIT family protein [Patescibacteria group bacterium]
MEDSVFTKIIKRELPGEIVYEDDVVVGILNIFPNIEGEMMVIPKEQVAYFADLDDETYAHLMSVVKRMAKVLDVTFNTLRTCVVIEGFDVPHIHVRLYPVQTGRLELKHSPQATPEELRTVGDKIRSHLS